MRLFLISPFWLKMRRVPTLLIAMDSDRRFAVRRE